MVFRLNVADSNAVGFDVRWIPGPVASCPQQLRVLVWYPASVSRRNRRGTVATYVAAARSAGDTTWKSASAASMSSDSTIVSEIAGFAPSTIDRDVVDSILATRTVAVPRARPMAGRHPLILLGNGFGPPYYLHWALGEHLAADGYVVATVAGATCGEHRGASVSSIEAMARDLEAVARSFSNDDAVDVGRIGLVGWSGGGLAQAIMAAADTNVRALVSLDGATGYAYGKSMFDSLTDLNRSQLTTPYVHLTGDATPKFVVAKNFFFYDSLARGPAYLVHFRSLNHASFTSLGALVATRTDAQNGPMIAVAYADAMRFTGWFLDTYVMPRRRERERGRFGRRVAQAANSRRPRPT